MPIDLGRYARIAKTAIDFGLPILGTALGVPGPVSEFAASSIKRALGLSQKASPEDVSNAIAADPDVAKAQLSALQSLSDRTTSGSRPS